MVKSFLQHWLPWIFGRTKEHARAQPAAERRAPGPLADGDDAQAIAELAAIGARRPLVSSAGAVVGFEFCIGDEVARQLKRQTDAHARTARVEALLASAHVIVHTGRIGFARMPAQWLVHASGVDVGPGVLIGLESNAAVSVTPQVALDMEQAIVALRARGAQVGWEPELAMALKPDFVLLRQGAKAMSALLDAIPAWPAELQGLPVLVTDICNVEELEMALYYGVTYACGVLDRDAEAVESAAKHAVPPEVRRVSLLLNQLVSGADTAVVVGQIKGDVGLSYRLLSRINSASYAQLGSYASVEQAVLLLGRYELYRWLSMLMVQFAGSRKACSALQEMTLWRSRLLELVAMEQHEPAPDQFFTLGLASMLGPLLKISQAEVVDMLNLPVLARQALLEHAGPWHAYLQMTKHIETRTLEQSAELVAQFGGTAGLMPLSDQAWHWAAEQTAHVDASDAGKAV
ncbi:MAG: HDOD domain-containing protein [Pseudomonadota bacterium]